jgi:hypothetical protein
LLTVTYKPSASTIEVSTYDSANGWAQRGAVWCACAPDPDGRLVCGQQRMWGAGALERHG